MTSVEKSCVCPQCKQVKYPFDMLFNGVCFTCDLERDMNERRRWRIEAKNTLSAQRYACEKERRKLITAGRRASRALDKCVLVRARAMATKRGQEIGNLLGIK